jgi:hypothetical protein
MIVELHRLASTRSSRHHSGVARKREHINISYEPDRLGDLKTALDRLTDIKDSMWFGRTRADAAGLLLAQALEAELAKNGLAHLTHVSQTLEMEESPVKMKRGAS